MQKQACPHLHLSPSAPFAKAEETKHFIDNSFRDGELKTIGTDVDNILPPMSRFGGSNIEVKKQTAIEKLKQIFDKYFGLV